MAHYIIYKDGAYNVFSTIVDAPLFASALTEKQLRDWHRQQFGEDGETSIDGRMTRARRTGCSGLGWTLRECIDGNRAGKNERHLAEDIFLRHFLTLPA